MLTTCFGAETIDFTLKFKGSCGSDFEVHKRSVYPISMVYISKRFDIYTVDI